MRKREIQVELGQAGQQVLTAPEQRAKAWLWSSFDKWQSALKACQEVIEVRGDSDRHARYMASICLANLAKPNEAADMLPETEVDSEPLLKQLAEQARVAIRHATESRPSGGVSPDLK